MKGYNLEMKVVNIIDRRKCRYCPERLKNLVGENCLIELENGKAIDKIEIIVTCPKQSKKNDR